MTSRTLVVAAAVALSVGAAATWAVVLRPVPHWERSVTRWFDSWPDALAHTLWPVMQLGTLWAPIAAAVAIAVVWRRFPHAVLTASGGLVAWYAAKAAKAIVERGRPVQYIPGIDLRGDTTGGFGFPSGHSTVAAFTAVMVLPLLPPRWRPLPLAVAVMVGASRMVYGVHFPVDVLGGWALGAGVGIVGLAALRVWQRSFRSAEADPPPM